MMFREDKATQLAAYLIKKAGNRCNYTVLQKTMYASDRAMLLKWGMPITYDQWVALHSGPVLSMTLDLIKGKKSGTGYWTSHIARDDYDAVLACDPGDDALSDAELSVADQSFETFGQLEFPKAIELSHEMFAEWTDPGGGSYPILPQTILQAEGSDTPEHLEEIKAHYQLNEVLAAR